MSNTRSNNAADVLTVERLFSAPAINGELPSHMKFAPDGKHIAWLQVAEDDRERLDLWLFDVASGATRQILDASTVGQGGILSDAEKAERERKRQFTGGVTNYHWHPDSARIVVEIDGMLYLLTPVSATLAALTPPGTRQTHPKFSPDGRWLALVRDYNLVLLDLTNTPSERALTTTGTQLRHFGLPDFIAQEEMHRFDGYWWTSDSNAIVYTEVDNSTVEVSQRYEIDADDFRVIEQRYPYAGAANATTRLALHKLSSAEPKWIDWRDNSDDYLCRVDCAQNNIFVQVQNRAQQQLRLKRWETDQITAQPEVLLTETSNTWINLHNNFHALDNQRFLWTSARAGYEHLYLYDPTTPDPTALTSGRGYVSQVLHADDHGVMFTGWLSEPTEQHLYRCEFSAGSVSAARALTSGDGWHDVNVAEAGTAWIDKHSSFALPAALELGKLSATGAVERRTIASLAIDQTHPYATFLASHITPTMGSIDGADGEPLYYRLTEPANKSPGQKYPVVVYVYGGPGGARVNSAWPPLLLQLFASRGFGVLELDNRGTGNRSKAFDDAIYLRLGKVEVEDQLLGVEFLRSLAWVDADRIGVFGHSYGGYMTLMCMAQAPDVFKAGVSVAPVSGWELYDTHYTERYLSTPQANAVGYEQSSVFPYIDKLRGELLLIHGMADDNVLFTNSTKLYKALQDIGTPFQMMTYPGSKHALHERSVSIHRFNALFKFFEDNL